MRHLINARCESWDMRIAQVRVIQIQYPQLNHPRKALGESSLDLMTALAIAARLYANSLDIWTALPKCFVKIRGLFNGIIIVDDLEETIELANYLKYDALHIKRLTLVRRWEPIRREVEGQDWVGKVVENHLWPILLRWNFEIFLSQAPAFSVSP
jgi:hypothetical protein